MRCVSSNENAPSPPRSHHRDDPMPATDTTVTVSARGRERHHPAPALLSCRALSGIREFGSFGLAGPYPAATLLPGWCARRGGAILYARLLCRPAKAVRGRIRVPADLGLGGAIATAAGCAVGWSRPGSPCTAAGPSS